MSFTDVTQEIQDAIASGSASKHFTSNEIARFADDARRNPDGSKKDFAANRGLLDCASPFRSAGLSLFGGRVPGREDMVRLYMRGTTTDIKAQRDIRRDASAKEIFDTWCEMFWEHFMRPPIAEFYAGNIDKE